jgi:ATP-dependent Lon protease
MEEQYTCEEHEYYKKQSKSFKKKMALAEKAIADMNNDVVPIRFKILDSMIDDQLKAIAIQKLNHLYDMDSSSDEYHKNLHWIESVLKIPFGVYKTLPVDPTSSSVEIKDFISTIKSNMDTKVYGHSKAKDQVIRLLGQWISNPSSKGLVIGIHGQMGTGKTSLIKEAICEVLGLPFAFIPLGGVSDGSYLLGHSITYQNSVWGKIVDVLMRSKCMNPVLFFDELDKVSTTRYGDEIINTLIHLTDSTQNDKFHDKYFSNIEFDLSRCLVIFSYNNEDHINPILKDRMVKIKTDGYTSGDKIKIARNHLIPGILSEFTIDADALEFSDEILKSIISKVAAEEGVRNLKRALHDIISNLNLMKLLDGELCKVVLDDHVTKFVASGSENVSLSMMYV